MKNLKALCLAFLLLVGTLAQESETLAEAEGGIVCNNEDGEGCQPADYLGLRTYNGQGLKLKELNTTVFIDPPYALIQHTLVYENNFNEPKDLVFYYNTPDSTIVSNISASWDNRDIEAELISQEDAEDMFSRVANPNAFSIAARGIPAFLVGTVPPGRDVTVKYTIIQPLTLIDNTFWAFSLYNTVAAKDDFRTRAWNSTVNYDDTILQGTGLTKWNLNVVISSRRPLDVVLNPTQNIKSVRSVERNRTLETWNVTIDPSKDFVLFFTGPGFHNLHYVFTKHPYLPSDWIFGYTLVPVANDLTPAQVAARILSSKTIADVDQGHSNTPVLVNITSSVTCNNTQGDTIFSARTRNGSVGTDRAWEQYFFLRNLVDPDGCRLNISYVNTHTRATTYTRYSFRGFSLARTTDEWHKIAYSEEFQEFESGETSNIAPEEVTDLAIRYQVKADHTLWVTVAEANNHVLDDSLRYYFSPEEQPNAENNENAEGAIGIGLNEGENGEAPTNQNNEASAQASASASVGAGGVNAEAEGSASTTSNNQQSGGQGY